MVIEYGSINFHILREHLWAAPKRSILGAGGRRVTLLAHRIRSATQRSNNEQQSRRATKHRGASNKHSLTVLVFGRVGEPVQCSHHCTGSTPTIPEGAIQWSRLTTAYNKSLSKQGLRMQRLPLRSARREGRQAGANGPRAQASVIARREIVALAKDYLAVHPELIAEAKPIVEQWRRRGSLERRLRGLVTF